MCLPLSGTVEPEGTAGPA